MAKDTDFKFGTHAPSVGPNMTPDLATASMDVKLVPIPINHVALL